MYNSDLTIDLSNNNIEFYDKDETKWRVTLVDTGENTLKGGRIKRVEKLDDSLIFINFSVITFLLIKFL